MWGMENSHTVPLHTDTRYNDKIYFIDNDKICFIDNFTDMESSLKR